ncbi:N-methyl-L-tryptophan oxidase [Campylobacter helveticus]|uniref:N-methyl-L-tryptophan oxidase n=1 Tax=Campylobacter helveticus TaxID=28898 RepID=UPI00214A4479|nr:N-methyl-L-tryptophan oxidase [Campylobacter helveticus]MCR2061393.1 N-methyl-L-tryptophan oxidase [Campylobacter helveticus]
MLYDIAIIGSGTVGAFAGYYAAKEGKKVCLIDKFEAPHTQGSYHGDTRIFRIAYGEGSKYIPLLQQAYTLWGEFEKTHRIKLFERGGLLNVGSYENDFMQNILASVKEFKLHTKKLNSKEIYENYGIKVAKDFFGILEPDTGFVYSDLSVHRAILEARNLGACVLIDTLKGVDKKEDIFTLSFENREKIRAKQILICAGSFVNEVLDCFHFDLAPVCVKAKRKVVHWYESLGNYPASKLSSFIIEFEDDHFYGFYDFKDGLKIGRDKSGQLINGREERKDFGAYTEDLSEINAHIKDFFPKIGPFKKGSVCSYPLSPDDDFIIDFLNENVFFIGGLSHGFKFAPALGKIGFEALNSSKIEPDIEKHFDLKRFEGMI